MVASLVVILDVAIGWAYVVTRGMPAVLIGAFGGQLAVDSLVASAVFSLMVKDADGRQTWFSFAYLGSIRMLRVVHHLQLSDAVSTRSTWWRQLVFHALTVVIFVFAAAASILTLEILGSMREDGESWDLYRTVLFVMTTLLTVGDSTLTPRTFLGRIAAIGLIAWGSVHVVARLAPLAKDLLLDSSLGHGSYRPPLQVGPRGKEAKGSKSMWRSAGHLLVLGTPTAPMLWDFIVEIFHPNHFEYLDEAPDVVVMVSNQRTLTRLRRFLARRESVLFRDHVTLLLGEALDADDRSRAAVARAQRAVVLPNLSTVDVESDDNANIMRTFALCSAAPTLDIVCLLHTTEHRESTLVAAGSSCSFVSVDAFKLSLMAKACLTQGALSLICNLCKTIGADATSGQPWQREYATSLDCELYEVPLSPAYDGRSFGDVAEDVLARSLDGRVCLLGLIVAPRGGSDRARAVHIHPGAQTPIRAKQGGIAGVFIAPDLSAIRQLKESGEPLMTLRDLQRSNTKRTRFNLKSMTSLLDRTPAAGTKAVSPAPTDEPDAAEGTDPGLPPKRTAEEPPAKTAAWTRERRESAFAHEQYQRFVGLSAHRLMVCGVDMEAVTGISQALGSAPQSAQGPNAVRTGDHSGTVPSRSRAAQSPGGAGGRGGGGDTGDDQSLASVLRAAKANLAHEPPAWTPEEQRMKDIRHLEKLHDLVEAEAVAPHAVPASILEAGGHLVLCVVGDTTDGTDGALDGGSRGPSLGIEHFMRPLRDDRFRGQAMQPAVVVLAEALPGDWASAAECERLYFVRGSPLSVDDLDRAGFRKARAVAVARGHRGRDARASRVEDARMILAAQLIEANLPHDAQCPIVTDHAYKGSCYFLPVGRNSSFTEFGDTTCTVPDIPDVADVVRSFLSGKGGVVGDDFDLGSKPCEEDYEDLDSRDYARHPRFMCGQVFPAPSMTALVANMFYNQSLLPLMSALLQAPIMLMELPSEWARKSYGEFATWLLRCKNLLVLGLYRSAEGAQAAGGRQDADEAVPEYHFVYTTPPAQDTRLQRSDRVLCVAPSGAP